MISSFTTTDAEDPLNQWLMLSDADRAAAAAPSAAVLTAAQENTERDQYGDRQVGCDRGIKTFQITPNTDALLSAEQRRQCIRFMDAAQALVAPDSADIKITLGTTINKHEHRTIGRSGEAAFNALFQLDSGERYARLLALHPGDSKIALRRTEGPVEGCIGFHIDGIYATHTVQLALNDDSEYDGGRICGGVQGDHGEVEVQPAKTVTQDQLILLGST